MQDIETAAGFKPGMLHAVEIRFCGENIQELLSTIRRWCARTEAQPTTFRYWLSEPDSLLRVNSSVKNRLTPSPGRSMAWFSFRHTAHWPT